MAKAFILALDQGTTSSRAIIFDHEGAIRASCNEEFKQIYPQPGWVEHDPEEIWRTQCNTARNVLKDAGLTAEDIAAIGITNQRETALIWDRATGEPVHNAIVWQCRRTTEICEQLAADGLTDLYRERTGLVLDAYFSGTKVKWLLDNVPGARKRAEKGELCFGTVDAWLLYKLTGRHATDPSNASRTLLYNILEHRWDEELLKPLDVPAEVLPEVLPTSGVVGETGVLGGAIPVCGMCGDQQSALFGQTAFGHLESKNTYGTGCFLLANTGDIPVKSNHGLVTTIAWDLGEGPQYALEGSIFIAGAVVQWLRDELRMISSAAESETVAAEVEDTGGVYVVPAFVGLGAPHWDMRARGMIVGLTRGTNRAHIVRAALESMSFQTCDIIRSMESDTGETIPILKVDGGAAANNLLMQHQADILGIPVVRGKVTDTTALGAAFLAGLAVGFWPDQHALRGIWQEERTFTPEWDESRRSAALSGWERSIKMARLR
jgi:glycerol kinase